MKENLGGSNFESMFKLNYESRNNEQSTKSQTHF